MVVLLWGLSWIILVGAAIFKAAGLLQEQGRDECDNQRGAQQEEQVAKSQDESLLLHDLDMLVLHSAEQQQSINPYS